jgi:hypothetical protein
MESGLPDCHPGMVWNFTLEELLQEMQRQHVTQCSFKFCLSWHSYQASLGRLLCSPSTSSSSNQKIIKFMLYKAY